MSSPTTNPPLNPGVTSLGSKLTNILVSPSYVFEEIAQVPHHMANWLAPMCLVCLTSLLLLAFTRDKETLAGTLRGLVEKETITQTQSSTLSATWSSVSASAVCFSAIAGTFWSAWILWLMGKLFLGTKLTYGKALEIVGLASIITVLGAVVTLALVAAAGDPAARPALSLLAGRLPRESPLYAVLQHLDVFHFWSATVLGIGLSRVGRIPFREAGFWVFGYWILVPAALALLA